MSSWEDYIDSLQDDVCTFSKDELKNLVNTAKNDSNEFIKKQGEKLERYLNQLILQQITKEQFRSYVDDIKELTKMESLKMQVDAKVRAQDFSNGIRTIVLKGLLKTIEML